jgi:hypothetical protein
MFERLRRMLGLRRKSPRELAEDEAARRRARQEVDEAERRMAEERQRQDSAIPRGGGGLGGWS